MPSPKPSNQSKTHDHKTALESTAIHFLSFRPRFKSEVINRLGRKATELGLTDPFTLINQIIDSIENSGFINDQKLLESYIRSHLMEKTKGPHWIKAHLLHLGLVRNEVDTALREFASRSDQLSALRQYLGRKGLAADLDLKTKAKVFRRLISRGFGSDLVAEAFDQIRQGE